MSADNKQVSGDHYKVADNSAQHWNMLLALYFGPEYYIGQATKYLSRWRKKNGLRDLLKGQHFIEKLIEIVEDRGDKFLPYGHVADEDDLKLIISDHWHSHLQHYFQVNGVDDESSSACMLVIFANSVGMLKEAVEVCVSLAEAEKQNPTVLKELEPPVAKQFLFMGYIDDGVGIRWRCKKCGKELELQMNQPPALMHKSCNGEPVTVVVPTL